MSNDDALAALGVQTGEWGQQFRAQAGFGDRETLERFQATVLLHESGEALIDRVWPGMGVLEAIDKHTCRFHLAAETPRDPVWMITSVDTDFTPEAGPPELAEAFRAQAHRCARAAP
jgi:hypothetical protein